MVESCFFSPLVSKNTRVNLWIPVRKGTLTIACVVYCFTIEVLPSYSNESIQGASYLFTRHSFKKIVIVFAIACFVHILLEASITTSLRPVSRFSLQNEYGKFRMKPKKFYGDDNYCMLLMVTNGLKAMGFHL